MAERSFRKLISWRLVAALVVMFHFDWHMARPHSMRYSGAWEHHWILGLITLSAAAWFIVGKWPHARWRAAAINLGIAILLAQIVEPFVYGILDHGLPSFGDAFFWQAFGEFIVGGIFAFAGIMLLYRKGQNFDAKDSVDR